MAQVEEESGDEEIDAGDGVGGWSGSILTSPGLLGVCPSSADADCAALSLAVPSQPPRVPAVLPAPSVPADVYPTPPAGHVAMDPAAGVLSGSAVQFSGHLPIAPESEFSESLGASFQAPVVMWCPSRPFVLVKGSGDEKRRNNWYRSPARHLRALC